MLSVFCGTEVCCLITRFTQAFAPAGYRLGISLGAGMSDDWTMPEWMEPYRELIRNTGGNPIEELVNDRTTNAQSNMIRAALIVAVESQVGLLMSLHAKGLLAPVEQSEVRQ